MAGYGDYVEFNSSDRSLTENRLSFLDIADYFGESNEAHESNKPPTESDAGMRLPDFELANIQRDANSRDEKALKDNLAALGRSLEGKSDKQAAGLFKEFLKDNLDRLRSKGPDAQDILDEALKGTNYKAQLEFYRQAFEFAGLAAVEFVNRSSGKSVFRQEIQYQEGPRVK